jgi:hypothetical protein
MNGKREPDLSDWVDDLGEVVGRLSADPARWSSGFALSAPAVDLDADMAEANDLGKVALYSAWHIVKRRYLEAGGDPAALLPDHAALAVVVVGGPGQIADINASAMTRRLYAIARGVALDAAAEMGTRWGDSLPSGFRGLMEQRRERAVAQAIASQRPGETISEVLARAGVSRAQGYRIMSRKGRP